MEQFKKEVYYLIHEYQGYGMQAFFDKDFDGSCPCAWGYLVIDGIRYDIHTSCWRVGNGNCTLEVKCKDSKNRAEVIKILKMALDKQDWYGEYVVK
jgi:hypothetical protein